MQAWTWLQPKHQYIQTPLYQFELPLFEQKVPTHKLPTQKKVQLARPEKITSKQESMSVPTQKIDPVERANTKN